MLVDKSTVVDTKREIIDFGKELFEQGLVCGSGGNISVCIDGDMFLFTPTGFFLNRLSEDVISETDCRGNLLSGNKPTKEVPLHMAAYSIRPDIKAVVHTHSPYAVALSCLFPPGSRIPAFTSGLPGKVGIVEITDYYDSGSAELANCVSQMLANTNGVLLGHHGSVAIGKTLQSAISSAYEIEAAARIAVITESKGVTLPDDVVERILSRRWNKQ